MKNRLFLIAMCAGWLALLGSPAPAQQVGSSSTPSAADDLPKPAASPVASVATLSAASATPAGEATVKPRRHVKAGDDSDLDINEIVRQALDHSANRDRGGNGGEIPAVEILAVLVPILVPLGSFAMVLGIIALSVWSKAKQRRMTHETIRMMVEKGQQVPPELFITPKTVKPRNDFRTGVILIAVGAALLVFLRHNHDSGVGWIPLIIGIGYLVVWKVQGGSNAGSTGGGKAP
ncbi:MAG: DUF6249 domain-containing protein [Chthoniobacteraceae bacterium]